MLHLPSFQVTCIFKQHPFFGSLTLIMNILHTSDWHLGRMLYDKRRDHEFSAFLTWLLETLQKEAIDVLIVAGDIFDTSAPSHQAQALYYRFLCQVATTSCRHVIIVAGNHDSPTFINAPKELLQALDIHVVGQASTTETYQDEVLVLKDEHGVAELIVCAVPYLRDRDVRVAQAGESTDDKAKKTVLGIQQHYEQVAAIAQQKNAALAKPVPLVATGHLFAAGGKTLADDGVRDLYVGTLAHISADLFPSCFDYVALGHLHVPQRVANNDLIRYSGSPIPMGFGEAKQQKSVCKVHFDQNLKAQVSLIPVPTFQRLVRISGDWDHITQQLAALRQDSSHSDSIWVEIIYTSQRLMPDLREQIDALTQDSQIEVLRIQNQALAPTALTQNHEKESLDQLSEMDVFQRCLEAHDIDASQHAELVSAFNEIWHDALDTTPTTST